MMNIRYYLVCCGAVLFAAGCRASSASLPTPTSVPPTQTGTSILAATSSPTHTSTATRIPTQATPTLTPVFVPTFAASEREMFVKKLLAVPVCQLPCWWGFHPGQSLWSEVANFLQGIGSKTGLDTAKGATMVYGTGGFDFSAISTYNRIDFYERAGVVEAITIDVEGYQNPEAFRQVWAEYAPEKIIGAYGSPSRVWVQSISTVHEGPIGSTMPYDLWLFYDTEGFLIRYGGTVKYATTYTFCPTFTGSDSTLHTLNMVLQSPTSKIALEAVNDFLKNGTHGVRPLEEVTDLNTDGFHDLFVEEVIQPCFTTARDVWP